jgi:hypothetical protein
VWAEVARYSEIRRKGRLALSARVEPQIDDEQRARIAAMGEAAVRDMKARQRASEPHAAEPRSPAHALDALIARAYPDLTPEERAAKSEAMP